MGDAEERAQDVHVQPIGDNHPGTAQQSETAL